MLSTVAIDPSKSLWPRVITERPSNQRSWKGCEVVRPDDGPYPWANERQQEREFFKRFQRAVAINDREQIASMMRYPLHINYEILDAVGFDNIDSREGLLLNYDTIFNHRTKDAIKEIDANSLGGERYLPRVEIFVEDLNDYPACHFEIKISRFDIDIPANNTIWTDPILEP